MSISVIQSASYLEEGQYNRSFEFPISFGGNVTAGNTIVALVGGTAPVDVLSITSVTDSLGNEYELIGSIADGGVSDGSGNTLYSQVMIYVARNVLGGACTVTLSANYPSGYNSTNSAGAGICAVEVSGLGSAPVDAMASGHSTSFPPAITLTPVAESTIALGLMWQWKTVDEYFNPQPGSGWTLDSNNSVFNGNIYAGAGNIYEWIYAISEHQILSNNAPVTVDVGGDLTSSGNAWLGIAVTFPAATTATPTFSPGAGTYSGPQSVAISCATEGALIYFTLDGSTPTLYSTEYSEPIPISSNTTIKAIAFAAGTGASSIGSASYVINAQPTSVVFAGFAPSWASGQNETSMSVFIAPGSTNNGASTVFDGGLFMVPTKSAIYFWTDDTGVVQSGPALPAGAYAIAKVVSGLVTTGTNGQTANGILSISDLRGTN